MQADPFSSRATVTIYTELCTVFCIIYFLCVSSFTQTSRYTIKYSIKGYGTLARLGNRLSSCLKKNLNASRPSEHPPVVGENVEAFRWNHRLQSIRTHSESMSTMYPFANALVYRYSHECVYQVLYLCLFCSL